jgi:hypothetical protein
MIAISEPNERAKAQTNTTEQIVIKADGTANTQQPAATATPNNVHMPDNVHVPNNVHVVDNAHVPGGGTTSQR